ncbi:Glycerophosphoryl diester phosphodiesterase [Halalkaliarchaeum sp. AArc-CO]|uniref:glycerophosphodiester phosphodiesterase n=1 Tax=unclassified Halalkaliarchaeum TaxID=2678344 RepID=UPI00217DA8E0|nr:MULTISPECIES: glycerophosphodiester phosphodiesterase family protein [unclassified Halalkaliarchaeum]MDR5672191.1 glycerophosphodiester phosphodiesterase family protein [Halalkaliarchaeum sp. AArc-GB]UWG51697.1 Glycerophosphoryl diester phosphodiesterase [Halalkaliarchaeum sp. AArc-CO]
MGRSRPPIGRRRDDGEPALRIGHRGCADQHPENTVEAIEQSAPYVDGFEIDVRPCGSGELVVFHDETLDRVTDGTGRVDETTLGELRELEVLDSGETVPTLGELLSAVPDWLPVNVELKATGIEKEVLEICGDADVEVLYSSFFVRALRELRDADEAAPVGVLCHEGVDDRLALAEELKAVAFHPSMELALETDIVERCHDRGLAVNVWTAETEADVRRLRERAVDGIIADRWDVF